MRYKLKIYRSNKSLEAQLLDRGSILLGRKYFWKKAEKDPLQQCFSFGEQFGAELAEKGLRQITFDRNGFKYHGKLKSFAQGLRKAKIEF